MAVADDDTTRLLQDAEAYTKVAFCFLGLYAWEVCQTVPAVELALVRRARWRGPAHVAAVACRLATLAALICMVAEHVNEVLPSCKSLSVATGILTATSLVFSLGLVMNSTIQLTPQRSLHLPLGCLYLFTTAFAYLSPLQCGNRSTTLVRLSLFFILVCYVVLLLFILPPSRTRTIPVFGQSVVDAHILAYTGLALLNTAPAVLSLLNIAPISKQIVTLPVLALTAILAVRISHLTPASDSTSPLHPDARRRASMDLFAHSSVVLTRAGAPLASSTRTGTSGQPSLQIATADLAPDPFPLASPGLVPAWAPAGGTRLSLDSAQISPIQFGGGNVLYSHA